MSDRIQIESGTQLLARLIRRPNLRSLEGALFPEGPGNTDVIEINGIRSTGKTLLLSQLLAKCILPDYDGAVHIKGCDASAVLINTDHHFQITNLVEIMTDIINTAYAPLVTLNSIDTNTRNINILRNSLQNLHIINCYHSEQFRVTLRTLDNIFLSNAQTALLAIDSLTAYYWQDRENNFTSIDAYIKKLLKIIRLHTNLCKVTTIYTKSWESIIKCKNNKSTIKYSTNTVEYRIHLRKTKCLYNHICILETEETIKKMCYRMSANGVKWETD
ncbi:X-ray repair cross complementing 2 [Megalopta genalis]|uniref:X-ray repair cross complementing 2 n=1 Tax=Megalopta genalis TaxID=115081 RepID=UPI0014435AC1|nr:DNA repair protein XRCC2 [Megalopta genalis]